MQIGEPLFLLLSECCPCCLDSCVPDPWGGPGIRAADVNHKISQPDVGNPYSGAGENTPKVPFWSTEYKVQYFDCIWCLIFLSYFIRIWLLTISNTFIVWVWNFPSVQWDWFSNQTSLIQLTSSSYLTAFSPLHIKLICNFSLSYSSSIVLLSL